MQLATSRGEGGVNILAHLSLVNVIVNHVAIHSTPTTGDPPILTDPSCVDLLILVRVHLIYVPRGGRSEARLNDLFA